MKPFNFGNRISEDTAPRHRTETEIRILQDGLAALPCGTFGAFLGAVHLADVMDEEEVEIAICELMDTGKNGLDALDFVEFATSQLCDAEGVYCGSDDAGDPYCVLPMSMILPECDYALFMQVGAYIDLIYRPHATQAERLVFQVSALTDTGFDLSMFDGAACAPMRHPTLLHDLKAILSH